MTKEHQEMVVLLREQNVPMRTAHIQNTMNDAASVIAELSAEVDSLKDQRENWRLSSVCRAMGAERDQAQAERDQIAAETARKSELLIGARECCRNLEIRAVTAEAQVATLRAALEVELKSNLKIARDWLPEEVQLFLKAQDKRIDDALAQTSAEPPTPFVCFRCQDGHTPLYCLNCAEEMRKVKP